jgi:hypothetical protein
MTERSWKVHLNFRSTFFFATFCLVSGRPNGAKLGKKYDVRELGLAKHEFPYVLVCKKDGSDVYWGSHASKIVLDIKNHPDLERQVYVFKNFQTLLQEGSAGSLSGGKSIGDVVKDFTTKFIKRFKDEMEECGYEEDNKLIFKLAVPITWTQGTKNAITTLLEEHGTMNEDLGFVPDTMLHNGQKLNPI